jgi:hypothetical protein
LSRVMFDLGNGARLITMQSAQIDLM